MVVPVLPGSLLVAVALLVWAVATASAPGWVVFAVAALLLLGGWASGYVLAGRQVAAAGVPRSSIVVAGLAGIVGFVVVPVIGLVLFFAAGLVAMEYLRRRELSPAISSAWVAIRATGLGILIELGAAMTAASLWVAAQLLGV